MSSSIFMGFSLTKTNHFFWIPQSIDPFPSAPLSAEPPLGLDQPLVPAAPAVRAAAGAEALGSAGQFVC